MNNYRQLTIWTLITNLLILIGAGHGVAPIGLLEAWSITSGRLPHMPFAFSGDYNNTLYLSISISFIGQIILFISMFNVKQIIKLIAIIILWIGFTYLTHGIATGDGLSWFSFTFGIPFLTCSTLLFIKTINIPKEALS